MGHHRISAVLLFAGLSILPSFAQDRTGLSNQTIKIGLFGPITGPASVAAKTVWGAAAIYKSVNETGGINGRKIELVIEDDACDANKGIAAVKKLISQDEVFLLHGAYCSAVALAIKPEIARQPTLPYIVLSAANPAISTPVVANLFHPTSTSKIIGEQMIEFALSKPGAKRIAVVKHSDEWGAGYFNPAVAALKARGLEPVNVVAFERGSTDATPQVLALKKSEPDAVLAILYPAELAIYMRDAYKYSLRTTTISTTAASIDDTDKRVGIPAAMNDLYLAYNLAGLITSPALSKYAQIFKKYYPSEALDVQAFDSMGGAIAIVEVLKRLGPDVSRERFLAAMDQLSDFQSGVQSGTLSFSREDHVGLKNVRMIALVRKKPVVFSKYGETVD
jgi:branched-chain amino acid transport system substrate-binding protein